MNAQYIIYLAINSLYNVRYVRPILIILFVSLLMKHISSMIDYMYPFDTMNIIFMNSSDIPNTMRHLI